MCNGSLFRCSTFCTLLNVGYQMGTWYQTCAYSCTTVGQLYPISHHFNTIVVGNECVKISVLYNNISSSWLMLNIMHSVSRFVIVATESDTTKHRSCCPMSEVFLKKSGGSDYFFEYTSC